MLIKCLRLEGSTKVENIGLRYQHSSNSLGVASGVVIAGNSRDVKEVKQWVLGEMCEATRINTALSQDSAGRLTEKPMAFLPESRWLRTRQLMNRSLRDPLSLFLRSLEHIYSPPLSVSPPTYLNYLDNMLFSFLKTSLLRNAILELGWRCGLQSSACCVNTRN